uniref:Uncharacterized protein n=1 Tax=Micrurus carvalhoi TaxID=3147026 RepID=A0A2H6NH16_9SAUR
MVPHMGYFYSQFISQFLNLEGICISFANPSALCRQIKETDPVITGTEKGLRHIYTNSSSHNMTDQRLHHFRQHACACSARRREGNLHTGVGEPQYIKKKLSITWFSIYEFHFCKSCQLKLEVIRVGNLFSNGIFSFSRLDIINLISSRCFGLQLPSDPAQKQRILGVEIQNNWKTLLTLSLLLTKHYKLLVLEMCTVMLLKSTKLAQLLLNFLFF